MPDDVIADATADVTADFLARLQKRLQQVPNQLSPHAAAQQVYNQAAPLAAETVLFAEAYGRVLAADIASLVDQPALDNSALDGYACRLDDTKAASKARPVQLELVGDVPAGTVFSGTLKPGQTVSIYTGAPVPTGADAIIGIEHTQRQGKAVFLYQAAQADAIRPRAQDLQQGAVVLSQGTTLTPAAVGLAASMGHDRLPVVRRPRVGLLVTGNEVIAPGQDLAPGQLYDANRYTLAGLLQQAGAEVVVIGSASDALVDLKAKLKDAHVDLILTTGGVSMGKYDFVRDLVFEDGEVIFWKIAMRPGGPALFGRYQGVPLFGLPGNPVSCMVVFELIVKPFLLACLGSRDPMPLDNTVRAVAESDFAGAGFKVAFRRARLQETARAGHLQRLATSTGAQGSNILTSMLAADGLVVVPAHQNIAAGDEVDVVLL
jgi:molybdopterin molybdotransferase